VRPAPPEEPDWIDLSLPREVYRPLALLAAFWQVSRENAVGLLVRAVQFQEWPLGDIMTDPAAYQEWALRVTKAATGLRLPTVKDESMRFDSQGWWAGVDRERRERERAERLMNDKLDAAAERQARALEEAGYSVEGARRSREEREDEHESE
jgi:hypothetical protein